MYDVAASSVTILNQGVEGATTGNWLPGGSGLGYLATAETAFNTAGVTVVSIMLGTNDSKPSVATSQATYGSELTTICANILANVSTCKTIVLNSPIYVYPFDSGSSGTLDNTSYGRLLSYQAEIPSIANNTTIFTGDVTGWLYFANNEQLINTDGVHPVNAGAVTLGGFWATAIHSALYTAAHPGATTSTSHGIRQY
jgi:lysophospholipase L1-like esterase